MVAFVGKPSDPITELPIAKSCLESLLCKSIRIESSSSSNLLTELFLLTTSCLKPFVQKNAMVFSEMDVFVDKIGGQESKTLGSSDISMS